MGAWYRAGSVTVTNGSKNVVGVDTYFTINSSIGDAFTLDGDKLYEIETITDNTHISLKTTYTETTASAQGYGIIRNFTGTTNATLAEKLTTLLNSWQSREDEVETWQGGTVSGGPNGNGTYPLTNAIGQVVYVMCPAKIAAMVNTAGLGSTINGATSKATPVDTDMVGLMDSAADNVLKKLSWANIKATFKSYFDTLYSPKAGPGSSQTFSTGALAATSISTTGSVTFGDNTTTHTVTLVGSSSGATGGASFVAGNGSTTYAAFGNTSALIGGGFDSTAMIYGAGNIRIAPAGVTKGEFSSTGLTVVGGIKSNVHNTDDLGTTVVRFKDAWFQSGAFNASDANLKTALRSFSPAEIKAAKEISRLIGVWQWLDRIAEKGADVARLHIGPTVQAAIEIMQNNGLDWTRYGFIGYDKWNDEIIEHPAVEAVEAQLAKYESQVSTEIALVDGIETEIKRTQLVCTKSAVEAVEAKAAWSETVLAAGEAYSFRYNELDMFIAGAIRAENDELQTKVMALEERLAALELE